MKQLDYRSDFWGNDGLTSEASIEVRSEHFLQFYRSQFETEADFRDALQDFILVKTAPIWDWKELCAFETRILCGLFNCSLEDDEH